MKLKSLHINRGYCKGDPLRGSIEFESNHGTEIKVELDEQLSADIVILCANAIARAGKAAADALTSEALQATAIEHQEEP